MAQCPNCSKSIAITDDQFGTLYRCEHCRTEFFIGFDGIPENSKEPLASDLVVEQLEAQPIAQALDSVADAAENPSAGMSLDFGVPESEATPVQGVSDLFNIQSTQDEAPSMALPDLSLPDGGAPVMETTEPTRKGDAFKNFADDVQSFGNEISESGVLSFDIEISGIDLGETKRNLLEALDDKRFGWNLDELVQNIKDGKLTISNISAPKIIVLVKRITAMGLVLNWRHHVATQ